MATSAITPPSNNPPILSEYITRAELAKQVGKCPRTIVSWIKKHNGPQEIPIGRTRLFKRADVLAWLESLRRAA